MVRGVNEDGNIEYTPEKRLKLPEGFTEESFIFAPDSNLKVTTRMVELAGEEYLDQEISFGETGVCVQQRLDFSTNTWSR